MSLFLLVSRFAHLARGIQQAFVFSVSNRVYLFCADEALESSTASKILLLYRWKGEPMSEACTLCGAILPGASTCQALHEELLNVETLNGYPHSLHFLHVTCFLIQHARYSDEALFWAQDLLRANLVEGVTEQQHFQLLRAAGQKTSSSPRAWKFERAADAPPLPRAAWSVTIVDVYEQRHSLQTYSEAVKRWARATLQEMTPLLR